MRSHSETAFRNPKITIGVPVYNGEKFIRKKIESLLSQTFTDFEIVISDNASTDSTFSICEEYAKKDKRIRCVRQEKNMGAIWNFNFLLQEAKSEYFVWSAVDDTILPEFLEKNIKILDSKNNAIGSISQVESYDVSTNVELDSIDRRFTKFRKKLGALKALGIYSLSGTYEAKVRQYLKRSSCQIIYGVFRTEKLQKCIISKSFLGNDWIFMLKVLKNGDFYTFDEILMQRYGGASEKGIIHVSRCFNEGMMGIIFPYYPFTSWCAKILGTSIFMKNLDYFIQLNLEGGFVFLLDLARLLIHKITKK